MWVSWTFFYFYFCFFIFLLYFLMFICLWLDIDMTFNKSLIYIQHTFTVHIFILHNTQYRNFRQVFRVDPHLPVLLQRSPVACCPVPWHWSWERHSLGASFFFQWRSCLVFLVCRMVIGSDVGFFLFWIQIHPTIFPVFMWYMCFWCHDE